jgi:hypothetical protein
MDNLSNDDESGDGDGMENSSGSEDYLDDSEEDNDDDEVEHEIVDKFIRTFSNGDYDTEFDNELCADRGADLPNTRPTQASYTKPDYWRERNRIGLERVKERLQSCIESAHYSQRFSLQLTHNDYGQQLIDDEEPIVWHESILDEYWNRLEEEIDQNKQLGIVTEIDHIGFTNVEMKKECLAALVAIFRNRSATNSSTDITFNNANLCEEGIVWLSKLVEVRSQLQYLFLQHNRIDSMDSASCLSRSLKSHTGIKNLHLCHCDLGSSPEILSVILHSDIICIILDYNNIDSLGAVKIAEYLESDPPMKYMSLENNGLNDDDVTLISQALKRNTNLEKIFFNMNNITSIGVKALLTCAFDSSSLNAISESNHTLIYMNIFSIYRGNENFDNCITKMLELDRADKIVLALQDKDSLLKYLANIPVELIPDVMAFPLQRVTNEQHYKHLNIVYSTMRWWNMPMLYSYHHDCSVKSDSKRKRD